MGFSAINGSAGHVARRSLVGRRLRFVSTALMLVGVIWGCVTTPEQKPLNYQDPVMYQTEMPDSTSLQAPAPVEQASPVSTTGSLWAVRDSSPFVDLKAHAVGDLVTIMVSEEASASNKGDTAFGRESNYKGNAKFLGAKVGEDEKMKTFEMGYEGNMTKDFSGNGKTTKASSMTAYMTARVIRVLPEGNLVIRGSRWTKVNSEMQQIVLEGIVRPVDVTRNNTVLSQNIADAKIFFVGKGPVTRNQKPGWLGQAIEHVAPF
ncbi:MAG: flagellar biosynthesis protein FlgH [Syntrophobacteraceae bacterium CG07_land_8_20_14_0_80_61_8]|nr:MAG: flagellar biosynthesis protein FlgH [Syntrophobacteraceae bacterium CG07_land_8_20_14_0_80_61_8]